MFKVFKCLKHFLNVPVVKKLRHKTETSTLHFSGLHYFTTHRCNFWKCLCGLLEVYLKGLNIYVAELMGLKHCSKKLEYKVSRAVP